MRSISSSSLKHHAHESPLLRRSIVLCTWLFLALFSSQRSLATEVGCAANPSVSQFLDPRAFLYFRQALRYSAHQRYWEEYWLPYLAQRSLGEMRLQNWSAPIPSIEVREIKRQVQLRALAPLIESLPAGCGVQDVGDSPFGDRSYFGQRWVGDRSWRMGLAPPESAAFCADYRWIRWINEMRWAHCLAVWDDIPGLSSWLVHPSFYDGNRVVDVHAYLGYSRATALFFALDALEVPHSNAHRLPQDGQSMQAAMLGPMPSGGSGSSVQSPVAALLPSKITHALSPQSPSASDEANLPAVPAPDVASNSERIGEVLGPHLPAPSKLRSDEGQLLQTRDSWGTYRLLNPTIEINPGQAFLMRNWYQTSRQAVSVQRRLQLPDGWKVGSNFRTTLDLTDNAATLDLVTILPPSNVPAGTYSCVLIHEFDGMPSPPLSIPVVVKPYYKVYVNTESLPPAISQDQAVSLDIRLENLGNTPVEITPECVSNLSAKITFTPDKIRLLPSERGSVRFSGRDVHLLGYQSDWVLNFSFRGQDDQLLGKASAQCPVYTNSLDRGRTYENSIDTQLQWLYASDGKLQDLVWQWSGSGYVNRARSRQVDFFLQVPGERSNGSQDPTNKGRFSLIDVDWRIDLGDATYVLSPLTQPGILARGARLYRTWHQLQLALFAAKERDYTANAAKSGSQVGGAATWTTDGGEYLFEVLNKRRQDISDTTLNSPHQRIFSASYRSVPKSWGRIVATVARNDKARDFPVESKRWAYQFNWTTPFKSRWQGSILWTQQQYGYWGSTQNRKEGSLFFSRQYAPLYVSLQGFFGRDNPGSESANSALQSQSAVLSLRKNLPKNLKGSLGLNYRRKFDLVQFSENDSSNGITPGLSYAGELLSIDGTCEVYRARDYLRNFTKWPQLNPQLSVEYQLLPILRVYWRGNWGATPLQVPFDGSTGHTLGLFWNLSSLADVSFSSNFTNSDNQRNLSYNTSVNWRPWPTHTLKFNYNANLYPRSTSPKTHTLMLNYSIYFGLPSGRSTGCALRGRVRDEQDPKSSHRYIVCLGGRKSFTSESGQYIFSDVPAGSYPLWLENLPPGKVEDDLGVQTVRLASGKLEKRDLLTTSAARISGHVRILRDDNKIVTDDRGQLTLKDSGGTVEGVAGAVITGKEEDSSRRIVAVTDAQGYFEFNQLRPGKGTVEAVDLPVPEEYKLDSPSSQVVTVQPDSNYDLEWRIVPIARHIKMLQ